jgi:hypothetical protein
MKNTTPFRYLCPIFLLFVYVSLTEAQKEMINVPAGTRLLVRTSDGIDSKKSKVGQRFSAKLETNLMAGDQVAAHGGSTVYMRLVEAKSAGRTTGKSELTIELTDIVAGGTAYPLISDDFSVAGKSETKKTAKKMARGAGLGAAIGAIRDGGSGAAKGAATGTIVNVGISAITKGEQVSIPAGTLLEFRLQQPASLPQP